MMLRPKTHKQLDKPEFVFGGKDLVLIFPGLKTYLLLYFYVLVCMW